MNHVRPAAETDIPVLVSFNLRMAEETENLKLDPEILTAGVSRLFEDPRKGRYFLAMHQGEIAGSLMITFEWSDWRNMDVIWLQSVYVRPEFRSAGVFRSLLSAVEQYARDTGTSLIRLYAETNNTRAHAVYRRTGFKEGHYAVWEKTIYPS